VKDHPLAGSNTRKRIDPQERMIMTCKSQAWISMAGLALAAVVISSGVATAANNDAVATCEKNKCAHVPATALDGTWEVLVGQVNCQSGAALGPVFPSLLAFAENGTMVETTSNHAFATGQREPGLGVWSRSSSGRYQATSVAFIQFTTGPSATSPGFEEGTQTITQTIEFTTGPDQWTADATIQFADTAGAIYRQGCATALGQRLR
jgi:uncharacterized membrane protein